MFLYALVSSWAAAAMGQFGPASPLSLVHACIAPSCRSSPEPSPCPQPLPIPPTSLAHSTHSVSLPCSLTCSSGCLWACLSVWGCYGLPAGSPAVLISRSCFLHCYTVLVTLVVVVVGVRIGPEIKSQQEAAERPLWFSQKRPQPTGPSSARLTLESGESGTEGGGGQMGPPAWAVSQLRPSKRGLPSSSPSIPQVTAGLECEGASLAAGLDMGGTLSGSCFNQSCPKLQW